MKLFNFNQTGGFKLVTDILTKIQSAYSIYNGVARMAGDKAILSGCEDLGTSVGDGYVVINGEMLEFKGALKQTTVIIKEEIGTADFEDGSTKPFETNRYATFGFSTTSFPWAEFKRVPALNSLPATITTLETNLNTKIDNLINALGFLKKGNVFIGDIANKPNGWTTTGAGYSIYLINSTPSGSGGDDLYRIVFTEPLPTNDFMLYGTINYSGDFNANNDVIFSITNKNVNGFDLSIREVSQIVQNLNFDFIIFKK
ncbi:hypothetical protein ASG31_08475 [Chryseobacterium sp. Leaf404]|uniref:hypothetical protein n=1 Tax=unclassified Chryseobacterium TaxID=2593645 RepID=UPI0006FB660E|nr:MULTISPECIES: hypothetical protein [unclassified Chryseobacterium]KQT17436.1 hypothetical protein ASG31_08475 [Chryseobacterium sp. Leaf404]